jgi:signal transduction histidine kinase
MLLANRKLHMLNEVTRHEIRNIVTGLVGSVDMAMAATSDAERDVLFRQKKELIAALQKQIEFTEEYEQVGVDSPRWHRVKPLIPSFSSLITTLSPEISDLEIYSDPLIVKVFVALAENSVRHGGHASAITVRADEHGHALSLIFEDNGKGVLPEMKEKIFERKIGVREGMALFLVREILGITGISITENGIPGQGARFEITVPTGIFRYTKIQ